VRVMIAELPKEARLWPHFAAITTARPAWLVLHNVPESTTE
jgi:hypothetical protein